MKKFINYLSVLLFILATHGFIYAQDFTVTIESTDAYAHYLPPIKAGGSHQFQIEVKNNRSDTCTVSIDKNSMGTDVSSWVTIDNNSQKIFPSQSKNFLLTINIPAGTCDCDFVMWLYFDAIDKYGNNHPFDYYPQGIIVDNSPPSSPTFSVSQTSTTIFVSSWDSWDDRSNTYTVWNPSAGTSGIKTYKVDIVAPNGTTIVDSETKKFSDRTYHKFENLDPYTAYKARVTAFDLVGNSKNAEKSATTAPAKPTGLTFSNITYIDATLSWSTSVGATGYDVYEFKDDEHTKLNNSPITGNSYKIEGLDPNTTHKYNVRALSNVGPSDRSDNASVTTLTLPGISGSSTICSGEYTYTIQGLLPGYTASWSNSSNLSKQSSSGSSANFIKILNGAGWIGANIIAPNARVLELSNKNVWAGIPAIPKTNPSGYPTISMQLDTYFNVWITEMKGASTSMSPVWTASGSLEIDHTTPNGCTYHAYTTGTGNFYVKTRNICGYSPSGGGTVSVYSGSGGGGGGGGLPRPLSVSPNPANDYIEAYIKDLTEEEQLDNEKLHIKIVNSNSIPVYNGTTQQKKFQINTSSFPEGVYYLLVQYKNQKYSTTILISR